MFGLKRMFVISLVIFTLASFANGIAPNLLFLDISRAVQAIGGAGVTSLSMALVATNFSGKERGLAIGILSSVIGLSTATGPLVGGYLVEYFSWPAIFFVNVPLGIIAIILSIMTVKETPFSSQKVKLDYLGMVLSAGGLFSLIYGLIQKETHTNLSWFSLQVSGWLVLAVVLLVHFATYFISYTQTGIPFVEMISGLIDYRETPIVSTAINHLRTLSLTLIRSLTTDPAEVAKNEQLFLNFVLGTLSLDTMRNSEDEVNQQAFQENIERILALIK